MKKFFTTIFSNKPLIVVFVGFLFTLATFLGNILLSIGVAEKLQKNVTKVETIYQSIVQLEELTHLLFMAESSLRTYALNQRQDVLEKFNNAKANFIQKSNHFIRHQNTDLVSLEVLVEFKNLVEERRDFFDKTLNSISNKSQNKAILLILFSQSSDKSLDIKALVSDIESDLKKNIDRQRISVLKNLDYTRYTNFIAILIALVVAVFANISIAQDYLRQKEIENKLRQLNDDKTRFFSILGHDLRTPFTSLNGIIYLLKNHLDDFSKDEIKEYIGGMEEAAKLYQTLLDDVLTWSRLQMNKIAFVPENLPLRETVEAVVHLFRDQYIAKKITVFIQIDENQMLMADKNALNTILRNIFSNAVKFTNAMGTIQIKTIEEKKSLKLTISDNGVGMTKQVLEKLFTPNTISSSGTANEAGTGLGLTICKEFIDRVGAKVEVSSIEGKGSVFALYFPL